MIKFPVLKKIHFSIWMYLKAIYCVFWIYILILEPGKYQTWKLVQYIIGIKPETRQRIKVAHCSRGIYICCLCIFDYKILCVCVKDRACLTIAVTTPSFNIFGSVFGVLFWWLNKKLILITKNIWKSMRKFICAVWSVKTFLDMDKEETLFF